MPFALHWSSQTSRPACGVVLAYPRAAERRVRASPLGQMASKSWLQCLWDRVSRALSLRRAIVACNIPCHLLLMCPIMCLCLFYAVHLVLVFVGCSCFCRKKGGVCAPALVSASFKHRVAFCFW